MPLYYQGKNEIFDHIDKDNVADIQKLVDQQDGMVICSAMFSHTYSNANAQGYTVAMHSPLQYAIDVGSDEVVKLLFAACGDKSERKDHLEQCIEKGRCKLFKALIEENKIDIVTLSRVLATAVRHNQHEAAAYLFGKEIIQRVAKEKGYGDVATNMLIMSMGSAGAYKSLSDVRMFQLCLDNTPVEQIQKNSIVPDLLKIWQGDKPGTELKAKHDKILLSLCKLCSQNNINLPSSDRLNCLRKEDFSAKAVMADSLYTLFGKQAPELRKMIIDMTENMDLERTLSK